MEELEYKQRCEKSAFDVDQELEDGKCLLDCLRQGSAPWVSSC